MSSIVIPRRAAKEELSKAPAAKEGRLNTPLSWLAPFLQSCRDYYYYSYALIMATVIKGPWPLILKISAHGQYVFGQPWE